MNPANYARWHKPSLAERFWANVTKRADDECWPWTGVLSKDGYGCLTVGGRKRRAHQVAWEVANGEAFPAGLIACHTCDTPPCVNPAHIFAGTLADNARDMVRKGRGQGQQKSHCPAGHEYTPENTYTPPETNGRQCRACNRRHVAARKARRAAQ